MRRFRLSLWEWVIAILGALIAAALLFSCSWSRDLSWTMPTATAKADPLGNVVDCSGGPAVRGLAGWRLYAQVQSRTWIDSGAAMQRDARTWARLWPRVSAEAMPRQVRSASSKHLPNGGAGQRITVSVPDSLDGEPVLCWYVVTFNDSLRISCPSSWRAAR